MSALIVQTRIERWPIASVFAISRGAKTEAVVVVAEISDGKYTGRGECVPYARYGESVESVVSLIEVWAGTDQTDLQHTLPAGAARNALDCALWDLRAKQTGRPVYELAGLGKPTPLTASYTLSLDAPDKMAEAALGHALMPLLKIKLGREGDAARIKAIRRAAPNARLIVDANEGWTAENISENLAACKNCGVELVEQPLPANDDAALAAIPHLLPICADESAFDRASLASLVGKYDAVNIKLDKTGGLTEALATIAQARQRGFGLMVGCMVSTSLSIAPAFLAAQQADFADLDGPFLLAQDRGGGLCYKDGLIYPPTADLWG
ncbi:MAG: dipeptide epimerase [Alphaproteobacteria bacterium]|nr:dipeptide epimerase [Alphaproteobacteria bacterium]